MYSLNVPNKYIAWKWRQAVLAHHMKSFRYIRTINSIVDMKTLFMEMVVLFYQILNSNTHNFAEVKLVTKAY